MKIEIDVPDGKCGEWRVESFEVTEEDAMRSRMRAAFHPNEDAVAAGHYKRLMRGGTVVMSNTSMEIRTHCHFIWRAKGRVLICGLGLGMVLKAILRKPEVEHVTVIEKSPDVITLVGPTFADDPRVTIVEGDAFAWKPPKGEKFDVAWHDIWDDICSDNLPKMKTLHRRFGRAVEWQSSWSRSMLERRAR